MNGNTNNTTYTRDQIEAMLPDYAFNRLSAAERVIFEREVTLYPDLQKELDEVKLVFDKIAHMDFNAEMNQRTKNLSVKVNARLQAQELRSKKRRSFLRIYIPAFTMILLAIGFMNRDFFSTPDVVSSDDELTSVLNHDASTDFLATQFSDLSASLPQAMIPREVSTASISSAVSADSDQIDDLIAQSIIMASSPDADSDGDDVTIEALDFRNTLDIKELEQSISEVEDVSG